MKAESALAGPPEPRHIDEVLSDALEQARALFRAGMTEVKLEIHYWPAGSHGPGGTNARITSERNIY